MMLGKPTSPFCIPVAGQYSDRQDLDIPYCSRVMRIFTNWLQQAGLMLSKTSPTKKDGLACQWLGNVDMQNVIEIYHVVQEIWTFSLTANGRTKRFLLGIFYVRKEANKAKSTQHIPFNFYGINLILSLLAPLICKWGLFRYWCLKTLNFGNSK